MNQSTAAPFARAPLPGGAVRAIQIVVVLAGIVLFAAAFRFWSSQTVIGGPAVMPTSPAIEAQWGVRVTHIGVSADGGLIDLRYIVLDPAKAAGLLDDVNNLPVMRTEPSARLVNSATLMANKHDLTAGRTYFLLYRNTGGAITPGSRVTVAFGDLRLEHAPAE